MQNCFQFVELAFNAVFLQVSRDSSIEKLTEKLRNWYLEKDGEQNSELVTVNSVQKVDHRFVVQMSLCDVAEVTIS